MVRLLGSFFVEVDIFVAPLFFLNLSFYQFLKTRLFSMNFSVLFQLLHYLFGFRYCLVTRFYYIFHHIKRKSFSLDNQWSKHSLSKLSIVGSSSSFKPFNIKWSLINPEKKYFLGLISSLFLSNDLALWLFVSCLYFHKTLALNVLSFLSFIDIDIHISKSN